MLVFTVNASSLYSMVTGTVLVMSGADDRGLLLQKRHFTDFECYSSERKKIKQHLNRPKSIFSAIASKNCNATATAQRKFDVGVTCLSVTQAHGINIRCLRCVRPLVQFFIQDSVQVIS